MPTGTLKKPLRSGVGEDDRGQPPAGTQRAAHARQRGGQRSGRYMSPSRQIAASKRARLERRALRRPSRARRRWSGRRRAPRARRSRGWPERGRWRGPRRRSRRGALPPASARRRPRRRRARARRLRPRPGRASSRSPRPARPRASGPSDARARPPAATARASWPCRRQGRTARGRRGHGEPPRRWRSDLFDPAQEVVARHLSDEVGMVVADVPLDGASPPRRRCLRGRRTRTRTGWPSPCKPLSAGVGEVVAPGPWIYLGATLEHEPAWRIQLLRTRGDRASGRAARGRPAGSPGAALLRVPRRPPRAAGAARRADRGGVG